MIFPYHLLKLPNNDLKIKKPTCTCVVFRMTHSSSWKCGGSSMNPRSELASSLRQRLGLIDWHFQYLGDLDPRICVVASTRLSEQHRFGEALVGGTTYMPDVFEVLGIYVAPRRGSDLIMLRILSLLYLHKAKFFFVFIFWLLSFQRLIRCPMDWSAEL